MKAQTPKTNWLIDAVLFGGFILAFFLNLTGLEAHQWIGIFGAALACYHLLIHWGWVRGSLRRLAAGTARGIWLNALVDGLIFSGMFAILASGLVISSWLSLALDNYLDWRIFHVLASLVTLALLVVKIGLHWRWILNVARRFASRPAPAAEAAAANAQTPKRTRRELIKLLGGASLVSLLAAANVLDTLVPSAQANGAETPTDASAGASATTGSSSSTGNSRGRRRGHATSNPVVPSANTNDSDPACVILCNRNCSFPGQCRRYVDTNQNNRCDLSECLS